MISYRITKYDPKKRNEKGHYLDRSEWTGMCDIKKPKYNVTYEEYEKAESAYVEAIQLILQAKKIETLKVKSLALMNVEEYFQEHLKEGTLKNIEVDFEKDIKPLKENQELNRLEIQKFTRLILRDIVWMLMVNKNIEVKFGYDYYMYVSCESLNTDTIAAIEKLGMFVEPYVGQIEYTIIDQDDNEIK